MGHCHGFVACKVITLPHSLFHSSSNSICFSDYAGVVSLTNSGNSSATAFGADFNGDVAHSMTVIA